MTARIRLRHALPALLTVAAITIGGFATPWLASAAGPAAAAPAMSSFPDASTTGWAHTGAHLTHSGAVTVTQDGAVIDSLDIAGNVVIRANNVTVRRSRITAGGYWPVIVDAGYRGFTISDSEIVGVQSATAVCKVGLTGSNMSILRVDVSNCEDGVHPGDNVTVQDSYIHDLWFGTNAAGARVVATHNDGIQVMSAANVTIRHNTIVTGHNQNSAVFLKGDFGPISNVVIDGNYLDGGCYTLYGKDTSSGRVTNVAITKNTFGPSFIYGALVTTMWTGPTVVSGNVNTSAKPVGGGKPVGALPSPSSPVTPPASSAPSAPVPGHHPTARPTPPAVDTNSPADDDPTDVASAQPAPAACDFTEGMSRAEALALATSAACVDAG